MKVNFAFLGNGSTFSHVFSYFMGIMTVCFDKTVMMSLWNKLWAQNFGYNTEINTNFHKVSEVWDSR